MGNIFQEACRLSLQAYPLNTAPEWLVLAPEMGSGKTMGALCYIAMMAKAAKTLPPSMQFGGVFVARTIRQCEMAVEAINTTSGYQAAISRHSKNNVTLAETYRHPVLVVTHAAVLRNSMRRPRKLLHALENWDGGPRCLTIVDEAVANAVDFHEINESALHAILADIPGDVRARHEFAYLFVEGLLGYLKHISRGSETSQVVWEQPQRHNSKFVAILRKSFFRLETDLGSSPSFANMWNDPATAKARLVSIQKSLEAILELEQNWSIFQKKAWRHTS